MTKNTASGCTFLECLFMLRVEVGVSTKFESLSFPGVCIVKVIKSGSDTIFNTISSIANTLGDTRGQCYKTFYCQSMVIVNPCYKAILASWLQYFWKVECSIKYATSGAGFKNFLFFLFQPQISWCPTTTPKPAPSLRPLPGVNLLKTFLFVKQTAAK